MAGKKLGDAFVTVKPDVTQMTPGVKSAAKQAGAAAGQSFHESFTSFVKTAVATAAGIVTGSALIEIGKMGIKTAADLEQAQVAFTTLTGSGQKARAFMEDLKKFAASTPFELPGLVDDARLLMGVGVSADRVIPSLTAWGNAASALGIKGEGFNRIMLAVSQSLSAGRINAGDMNQIVQAGIPVWTLIAKAMGKTVPEIRKMSEEGKLLSSDVLPLLEKQMNKDYTGAMNAQSKTLAGVWSTLMDTINLGMADSLQPLVPLLEGAIPKAATFLSAIMQAASKDFAEFIKLFTAGWTQGAGKGAGEIQQLGNAAHSVFNFLRTDGVAAIKAIAGALQSTVVVVADIVRWFNQHRNVAIALVATITALVAITKLHAAVMAVEAAGGVLKYIASINLVKVATTTWTAVQWLLDAALNANPIGLVVIAIAALIAIIILIVTHLDFFKNMWNTVWGFVKSVALSVANWFAGPFADFFIGVWNKILAVIKFFGDFIFITIPAKVRGFRDKVVEFVVNVALWFHNKFQEIVDFVGSIPGKLWSFFSGLPGKFVDLGKSIVQGIIDGISRMMGGLIDKARQMATDAWNAVKKAIGFGSPAKKWMPLGMSMGEGVAVGIDKSAEEVGKAARNMATPPDNAPAAAAAMAGDRVERLLAELRDAVERVAPGVGKEINGTGANLRRLSRAVS